MAFNESEQTDYKSLAMNKAVLIKSTVQSSDFHCHVIVLGRTSNSTCWQWDKRLWKTDAFCDGASFIATVVLLEIKYRKAF